MVAWECAGGAGGCKTKRKREKVLCVGRETGRQRAMERGAGSCGIVALVGGWVLYGDKIKSEMAGSGCVGWTEANRNWDVNLLWWRCSLAGGAEWWRAATRR